ncbi:helix-turn-helix domain-containing protein [Emcibacter nanhaiensis]|uniref:Helix-turn-helix domain-containing protein n=1 Tax=Emcibacter nanhaiensis TaxID=1505037 RepID=A0A501PKS2_9PROT|nr:XRE family transcriptional regulator [Emcibacter nanhaiensis]TPD60657.1 helix-turn-helix domain-containing protein [Emcibacter nanhaiensis]
MKDKDTSTAADITLGKRLREYRKSHGLRLADLGKKLGMSVSAISKIENGKMSLNFNSVLRIAEELSIPIASLVGPETDKLLGGRRAITRNGEGHLFSHDRWDMETLCDDMTQKQNVFWRMRVKCRNLEDYGEFSTHPGEEFLYILEGEMDLYTELYKPVRLKEGDSICFDGMTPHAYIAVSDKDPLVLMSNTIG